MSYEKPFSIIKEKVYPERKDHLNAAARKYWWQFYRPSPKLRSETKGNSRLLLLSQTSKFLTPVFVPNKLLPSKALVIFKDYSNAFYSIIQSTIHNEWAFKYGSTLSNTLRYSASDIFEMYPFPQKLSNSIPLKHEELGEQYHNHRHKFMFNTQLGLTKTYNAFHATNIMVGINTESLQGFDKKVIEKQYGKEVWYLWNHLQKTPSTCSIEEAIAGIMKLRELHVAMDLAVLEAYGWSDIQLKHDFYEVDYLPENDRVRYTIHPDARKEILKRLLDLNHKIHAEEVAAGLWDKKTTKPKPYKNKTSESSLAKEKEMGLGDLFNQE